MKTPNDAISVRQKILEFWAMLTIPCLAYVRVTSDVCKNALTLFVATVYCRRSNSLFRLVCLMQHCSLIGLSNVRSATVVNNSRVVKSSERLRYQHSEYQSPDWSTSCTVYGIKREPTNKPSYMIDWYSGLSLSLLNAAQQLTHSRETDNIRATRHPYCNFNTTNNHRYALSSRVWYTRQNSL
jgi:hypothetical protein